LFLVAFTAALLMVSLAFPPFFLRKKPLVAPHVTALCIYPIKSCAGIRYDATTPSTQTMIMNRFGFRFDRNWVVVDANGKHITSRQIAAMVLIQPAIDEAAGVLRITAPNMPDMAVPLSLADDTKASIVEITVWSDKMNAKCYPAHVNEWFTRYLGVDARLVTLISGKDHNRPLNKLWDVGKAEDRIMNAFTDAAPFLVTFLC